MRSVAFQGILATAAGQWSRFVLQALSIVILSRILSPADFGLFALVTVITSAGMLISDFGMSAATIQAKTITREQQTNVFWANLGIGIILTVSIAVLSLPIATALGHPNMQTLLAASSLVFVFQGASAQFTASATRDLRFIPLGIVDAAAQAVGLCFALVAAFMGMGVWALWCQQIAISVSTLLMLAFTSRWHPSWPRKGVTIRHFIGFGANTTGVQALNYLSTNIDTVVLARVASTADIGLYDKAYQLFRLPIQQLAAPLTRVALPILSKLEGDTFVQAISRAQRLLIYVLGGAFAVLISASNPVLSIVLGPQWLAASDIFSILAFGGIFQSMGYVYYWIFLSRNKTSVQLRFSLISRILMIGLILLGAFLFGINGVAMGVAVGHLANWCILTFRGLPAIGIRVAPILRSALLPLSAIIISMLVSRLIFDFTIQITSPWGDLAARVALLLCVFALQALAIPPLRRDVFAEIRFFLQQFISRS